ncbi:MAG: hypothetical protein ACREUO_03650, partial [Burkholderiales bacterium]
LKQPALADRPAAQLPARVARALLAERARGEILTSWVQAGVLSVFAALYFLAPSTSPVSILMRPVPWALALYAAFTAVRLHLAYRGGLGAAMRTLSVVLDMHARRSEGADRTLRRAQHQGRLPDHRDAGQGTLARILTKKPDVVSA